MGLFWDPAESIFGGALDLGFDYLGNELIGKPNANTAFKQSQKGAVDAFNRSYGAYKKRYQDTTADMKAAGLNPILAASSGFNVGSGTQSVAASGYMPQRGNLSATNSGLSLAKTGETKEKSKKLVREVQNLRAKTLNEIEKIYETRAKAGKANAEEANLIKRLRVTDMEYWKTLANYYESMSKSEVSIAQRKKLTAETQKLRYTLVELKKTAAIYNTPYFGQLLKSIERVLKAFVPLQFKLGD